MGSYSEHQKLVKEILVRIPSKFKNIRLWERQTGVARSMDGKRVIRYGLKGASDIEGIIGPHGTHIEIEVKTGNSQLRKEQINFSNMIRKHGGIFIEARYLDDVIKGIEEYEQRTNRFS